MPSDRPSEPTPKQQAARRRMDELSAELSHAERRVADERAARKSARRRSRDAREAAAVVQAVAEEAMRSAHAQVSAVVTRCLRSVFGEDACGFAIEFERKRGRTEARFVFTKGGHELDPTTACGGGVVDVAALALRIACLVLGRGRLRRLLALDEPAKFVSRDHQEAVRDLIVAMAEELDLQVLMVTHNERMAAGKVVEIGA